MNYIGDIFLSILNFTSDYTLQNKILKDDTRIFFDYVKDEKFVSQHFLDNIDTYPRYPNFFNAISDLKKYNIISIRNTLVDTPKALLSEITDNNILSLKTRLDPIPKKDIDIDFLLQKSFCSKIFNEIYQKTFFTDQSYAYNHKENYVNECMVCANKNTDLSTSFFMVYALYTLFRKNIQNGTSFYGDLYKKIGAQELYNDEAVIEFEKYVNDNIKDYTKKLVKFILYYTYNISTPSDSFIDGIVEYMSPYTKQITDVIKQYLDISEVYTLNTFIFINNMLNHDMSVRLMDISKNTDGIISTPIIEGQVTHEETCINKLLEHYNVNTISSFLYLDYIYNRYPEKFLNVLQLVLRSYTSMVLRNDKEYMCTPSEIISFISQISGHADSINSGVNKTILQDIIDTNLNNSFMTKNINEIIELCFTLSYSSIFDDIIRKDNHYFTNYLNIVYEEIFNYLRTTMQLEYSEDYFINKKMTSLFIRLYFRDAVINKTLFREQYNFINKTVLSIFDNEVSFTLEINDMLDKLRQYVRLSGINIENLFENMLTTAVNKKILVEQLTYYLN